MAALKQELQLKNVSFISSDARCAHYMTLINDGKQPPRQFVHPEEHRQEHRQEPQAPNRQRQCQNQVPRGDTGHSKTLSVSPTNPRHTIAFATNINNIPNQRSVRFTSFAVPDGATEPHKLLLLTSKLMGMQASSCTARPTHDSCHTVQVLHSIDGHRAKTLAQDSGSSLAQRRPKSFAQAADPDQSQQSKKTRGSEEAQEGR